MLTALEDAVRASTPLERALVGAGSVWGAEPDEAADSCPASPVAERAEEPLALRARLVADPRRGPCGRRAWRLPTGRSTSTSTPSSRTFWAARATRRIPPPSSRTVADRCAVARSWPGAPPPSQQVPWPWWVAGRGPDPERRVHRLRDAGTARPARARRPELQKVASWTRSRQPGHGSPRPGPGHHQPPRASRACSSPTTSPADGSWSRAPPTPAPTTSSCRPGRRDQGDDPKTLREVPFQSPFVAGGPGRDGPGRAHVTRHPAGRARPSLGHRGGLLAPPSSRPSRARCVASGWASPWWRASARRVCPDDPGPALRGRAAGFDGPAIGTAQTWVGQSGSDPLAGFAEETTRFVAAALAEPADSVRTEVVSDVIVGGSVIDPTAFSPSGRRRQGARAAQARPGAAPSSGRSASSTTAAAR